MSRIIDVIKKQQSIMVLGPIDTSSIQTAEKQLNLKFTKEYKDYTSTFGALSFNGLEFTGVVEPKDLNVVSVTNSARSIYPSISQDWYVVMDPHIDGIIIWQGQDNCIYQTQPKKEPQKIANSLAEYILSQA